MKTLTIATLVGASLFSCMKSELSAQGEYKNITFPTEDNGRIEASFFDASAEKVIIYAHGAVFNKESWYFLAEEFRKIEISSLCLDFRGYGNSKATNLNQKYFDILGAVKYLKAKGYSNIHLIGGSMGGAAVLEALSRINEPAVSKVVLLAPAGGSPLSSASINKLIIVSKNEGNYNRVKSVFDNSVEPKILMEYPGSAHAQHMFKEDYADELIKLIIDFIVEE